MRITPLNLAVAALLVWAAYQLALSHTLRAVNPIYLLGMVLLLSLADQFFRLRLKKLRRIWIAEILFIIFAAVLVLLFKSG